ncbi:MAG: hypothetical protein ACKOEF_01060, partial [Acidimicrobiaceae bacterium]
MLEVLEVGSNDCKVGGNVGTTGGGRVSGVRVPGVLELVVVLELLELLEASGPNGDVVVVVELVPEIDEVVPGKVVVVPPIVVVVELLDDDVDDGRTVVVVELLLLDDVDDGRTVVVVPRIVVDVDDAGRTVVSLVPLGQPPLGAGIRSPLWPPWPLRLLASTVISTYGFVA